MELYWIYLAIFGGTTIVGVPMLSFMQYKFIHGMPVSAWIEGLPLTFVIVAILWITIAIIMRFVMQPVIKAMKKAKTTELSDEEKLSFILVTLIFISFLKYYNLFLRTFQYITLNKIFL